MIFVTVCDDPMLEGETIARIPGAGTPGPDGLVELPSPEGKVTVPFATPAKQLTQLKVNPPAGTQPGDKVTVTVKFTNEDGTEEPKV